MESRSLSSGFFVANPQDAKVIGVARVLYSCRPLSDLFFYLCGAFRKKPYSNLLRSNLSHFPNSGFKRGQILSSMIGWASA